MRARHLRRVPFGVVLLIGVVVAIDPRPFAAIEATPTVVAAMSRITGETATTAPPTTAPATTVPPTTVTPSPTTAPPVVLPPSTTSPTPAPTTVAPAPATPVVPPPRATVARPRPMVLMVYANEGDRQPQQAVLGVTEFGNPRYLLTTALRGDWVQVMLPMRPNGLVGWVRSSDVDLSSVPDRIDIDLVAHRLTWTRDGAVLLQAVAGVGAPATPTPVGTFYVTDILPFDPREGRGNWVVALDGHSDAYATFDGGDARIAIHGTSNPSSVGESVSNGCVRLAEGPLDQLRAGVPLGTPVVVH